MDSNNSDAVMNEILALVTSMSQGQDTSRLQTAIGMLIDIQSRNTEILARLDSIMSAVADLNQRFDAIENQISSIQIPDPQPNPEVLLG